MKKIILRDEEYLREQQIARRRQDDHPEKQADVALPDDQSLAALRDDLGKRLSFLSPAHSRCSPCPRLS